MHDLRSEYSCYTGAMPAARTHDTLTLISGVALAPIVWVVSPDHSIATALTISAAHVLSGVAFSPDLDLNSRKYQNWGPLRFVWWPYRQIMPHRSWLSHGLIIGPLLRLAYFGIVVYGLLWIGFRLTNQMLVFQALQQTFAGFLRQHAGQVYAFLIGFVTGGAAHSIPDWITTGTKRAWHQWTKL